MQHRPTGEEMRERIVLFILCGLIIIGIYTVLILVAAPLILGRLEELSETGQNEIVNTIIGILLTILYVIPLYTVYFNQNATYKRFVLQETKDTFDLKSLFRKFMSIHGCWDILLYALYSVPLPIFWLISEPFVNQYLSFLYTQQVILYGLPIPQIVSYFLVIVVFVIEYIAVFAFAAWRWDKQRLHRD